LSLVAFGGTAGFAYTVPDVVMLFMAIFIVQLLTGFVTTSMSHLMMEALNHSGSAMSLFVVFGICEVTWALLVPLAIFSRAFDMKLDMTFFTLVAGVNIYLKAWIVDNVYGAGTWKSLLAVLLPYIAAGAAFFAAIVSFGAWIVMILFSYI